MALIDKASLLMVPSTYETGTLYNVLPSGNRAPDSTDQNSGYDQTRADFTFDRGTDHGATRIGSDGLIKKYRENLLVQSNQFDTNWVSIFTTETGGQTGYDGSSDAWLLTKTDANGRVYQTISSSGVQSVSTYVKANASSWVHLRADYSGNFAGAFFDLSGSGAVGTTNNIIDSDISSVGSGWYRVRITFNKAITLFRIYPAEGNNDTSGTTGSIYIQNAQLESGLVATDVLTSGATTAKAGVLIDLPRINYDANGENGALLLEPQRQQLIQYSEYFGAWTGFGGVQTITDNYAISPEGVQNAARVQLERSPSLSRIQLSTAGTSDGVSFVFSVYLKANSGSPYVYLQAGPNFSTAIEVTNEWERYDLVGTASGGTTTCIIGISDSVSGTTETADILVYGAQLESSASYQTSYIPNHGESGGVTRAADSCLDGGSAESINSTEGVLYAEISALADDGTYRIFSINDGTTNERVYIQYTNASNAIAVVVKNGGTTQANISHSLTDETQNTKVAFRYKANDFAFYVNGSQIGTDTSGSTPVGLNNFSFDQGNGANPFYGNVKQVAVFNEALSDSELATLTTL